MSAATFELKDWLGEYNRALEQLQAKSEEVVARVRNRLWLTQKLWSVYRDLRELIHDLNRFTEEFSDADLSLADLDSSMLVASTMKLHHTISSMVAYLQERGYANATVTGAVIDAIRGASLNVIDFAEMIDVSFDPTTRTAIKDARQAWDRSEVYPLA